jgi:hypothetical protein
MHVQYNVGNNRVFMNRVEMNGITNQEATEEVLKTQPNVLMMGRHTKGERSLFVAIVAE